MTWWRQVVDRRSIGDWGFELRGDELADLTWRGHPVLRSVRVAVRDRDWRSVTLEVDSIATTDTELILHIRSHGSGSSFTGVVRAEARDAGLRVVCDLASEQPFETNRTGLVALLPPGIAGLPLTVGHSDGSTVEASLRTSVSPHQPIGDIEALTWASDCAVSARFTGEVFEMEDQRNWTDASFKVYSRPLALPFPYPVAAGERVVQSIELTAHAVEADSESAVPSTQPARTTRRDSVALQTGGVFPAIGVGASTAPDPVSGSAPTAASLPHLASTLVELDLGWPGWPAVLERAAGAGRPLDVRLVLPAACDDASIGPPPALDHAVRALSGHTVARITAFQPTGDARHVADHTAIALLRASLRGRTVDVVAGVRSHFTELNRESDRVPPDVTGIVFAVTPLFHSLDTEQLVESVAMQRLVAQQAVEIAGGRHVHVGPISLRPHFNDAATTAPPRPASSDLSAGHGSHLTGPADPRQSAPELAAWTIASAAALSVAGVASLTFFEDWGPRGLIADTGTPRPAAAAVAALASLSGGRLLSGSSPDGLVWALGALGPSGTETVLGANIGRASRVIEVRTPGGIRVMHLAPGEWRRA